MDKVFFKIIIPNYNNIAYLPQCLDSILNQTFQDFKIILVDDQPTDFSYELAKSYERKHPDKLVVLRAETKRYAGGCRNIGIDYPLDCEYYYFIDSDDYLYKQNAFQLVYDELQSEPDVLLLNWYTDIAGNIQLNKFNNFKTYEHQLAQSPWNASWSRFTKNKLTEKFLEKSMRGEDTYQMLKILDRNPIIKQTINAIYVYRQTQTSAIHQPIFKEHCPVLVQALKDLLATAKDKNVKISINRRLGK